MIYTKLQSYGKSKWQSHAKVNENHIEKHDKNYKANQMTKALQEGKKVNTRR